MYLKTKLKTRTAQTATFSLAKCPCNKKFSKVHTTCQAVGKAYGTTRLRGRHPAFYLHSIIDKSQI